MLLFLFYCFTMVVEGLVNFNDFFKSEVEGYINRLVCNNLKLKILVNFHYFKYVWLVGFVIEEILEKKQTHYKSF